MRKMSFKKWRRIAATIEACLLLGLPFITIKGQSALRFDVPSLRLYFFGTSIAIDEFYLVLTALLFIVFLFISLTILLGRLWCGWACPQTVLSDITAFLERTSGAARAVMYLPVAALSMLVAADIIWYFVSPYDFIGMMAESPVVLWSFIALSVIIFMDLSFIRRIFCRTVCPYAKLQSVLFDDRTMLIAYDPALAKECMGCSACKRVCPVGIDIRNGLDMACISCAECIDACTGMRAKVGRDTLVSYFRGGPDRKPEGLILRPLRLNLIFALLASMVFLIIFIQSSSTRADFAASVRLDSGFNPPRVAQSSHVNSYILSVRNRTRLETRYMVRSDTARISTREELRLPPGGAGTFTVYATIAGAPGQSLPERIKIEIMREGDSEGIVLEAAFPAQ